jgi:CPA1 family monovalent cation:H+ antiporter
MALALQGEGIDVLLVDASRRNVAQARLAGLAARRGNALDEGIGKSLDLFGLGRVLAVTPNDEVNALVAMHYAHTFGRSQTYRLAADTIPTQGRVQAASDVGGRVLFAPSADYFALSARCARGKIRVTGLTEQFSYSDFLVLHGERVLPLFAIAVDGTLTVATAEKPLKPGPGAKVLAVVDTPPEPTEAADANATEL